MKPFSVPSMSVSMSGRKTRRGKGSRRCASEFVVEGGGSGGSVRPTVYKQNDMNSQIEINDQMQSNENQITRAESMAMPSPARFVLRQLLSPPSSTEGGMRRSKSEEKTERKPTYQPPPTNEQDHNPQEQPQGGQPRFERVEVEVEREAGSEDHLFLFSISLASIVVVCRSVVLFRTAPLRSMFFSRCPSSVVRW